MITLNTKFYMADIRERGFQAVADDILKKLESGPDGDHRPVVCLPGRARKLALLTRNAVSD